MQGLAVRQLRVVGFEPHLCSAFEPVEAQGCRAVGKILHAGRDLVRSRCFATPLEQQPIVFLGVIHKPILAVHGQRRLQRRDSRVVVTQAAIRQAGVELHGGHRYRVQCVAIQIHGAPRRVQGRAQFLFADGSTAAAIRAREMNLILEVRLAGSPPRQGQADRRTCSNKIELTLRGVQTSPAVFIVSLRKKIRVLQARIESLRRLRIDRVQSVNRGHECLPAGVVAGWCLGRIGRAP